jgi:hypothetical protein
MNNNIMPRWPDSLGRHIFSCIYDQVLRHVSGRVTAAVQRPLDARGRPFQSDRAAGSLCGLVETGAQVHIEIARGAWIQEI